MPNRLLKEGISKVNLNLCLKTLPDSSSGFMSIHYDLHGPNFSVSSACASSDTAIRLAGNAIRSGDIDISVCGGTVESAAAMMADVSARLTGILAAPPVVAVTAGRTAADLTTCTPPATSKPQMMAISGRQLSMTVFFIDWGRRSDL